MGELICNLNVFATARAVIRCDVPNWRIGLIALKKADCAVV